MTPRVQGLDNIEEMRTTIKRRRLVRLLGASLALWLGTFAMGVGQVRAEVLAIENDMAETSAVYLGATPTVSASSPFPLVVSVTSEIESLGPVCAGRGHSAYYLWLFGISLEFGRSEWLH